MESSVSPLLHQRSHLPNRTNRFLFHHLCSRFNRENQISLTKPAVLLQELALSTETIETKAEKVEKEFDAWRRFPQN